METSISDKVYSFLFNQGADAKIGHPNGWDFISSSGKYGKGGHLHYLKIEDRLEDAVYEKYLSKTYEQIQDREGPPTPQERKTGADALLCFYKAAPELKEDVSELKSILP